MSLATIRSWLGLTSKADAGSKSVGALLIKPVSSKNFKSVLDSTLNPLNDPNKTNVVNGFGQKLGILQQHGLEVAISFDKSVLKHSPKADPKAGVNVFSNSSSSTNQLGVNAAQGKTLATPIKTVSAVSFSSIKNGLADSLAVSDSKTNEISVEKPVKTSSKTGSVGEKQAIDERTLVTQANGQKNGSSTIASAKSIKSAVNGSAISSKQQESKSESSIFPHKKVDESVLEDNTKVSAKKVKVKSSTNQDSLQQAQIAEAGQKTLNKPVIKSLDAYSFDALESDEPEMETSPLVSNSDSKASENGQKVSISKVGNNVSQKNGLIENQEVKPNAEKSVAIGNEPEVSVKKVNTPVDSKSVSAPKEVLSSESVSNTVVSSLSSKGEQEKADVNTKKLVLLNHLALKLKLIR